jgi:RNA recognition motif-containing protein
LQIYSEADSEPDSKAPSANGHLEKASEGGSGARACSTLFIANLGPNCTEDELKQLLSRYPGFHILKIRARGGMPVAFADFEEIEQATDAMNHLQGNLLSSSDRGGMHIEYARSKMRKQ